MNQNKSNQPPLNGSRYTVNEDGTEAPQSDNQNEGILVKINRRGAHVSDENPFLFEAIRDMQTRQKRLTVARGTPMQLQSGEEGITTVEQLKDVDKKTFVKVFSGPDFRDIYNLSAPGLKLFLVVLDILGNVTSMGKVHIRLTTQMAKNLTAKAEKPLSKTTIDRGIKDLIDKGYLAGAEINGETEGWYWINPARFFNGDTIILKTIYRIARETRSEQIRIKYPHVPPETILKAMQNKGDYGFENDETTGESNE